jgi:hypothetical protein
MVKKQVRTMKYGYRRTAACMLCQKAHEECGSSWNGELPKETIGHIQSAGSDRHMTLLTIKTESRLGGTYCES